MKKSVGLLLMVVMFFTVVGTASAGNRQDAGGGLGAGWVQTSSGIYVPQSYSPPPPPPPPPPLWQKVLTEKAIDLGFNAAGGGVLATVGWVVRNPVKTAQIIVVTSGPILFPQ